MAIEKLLSNHELTDKQKKNIEILDVVRRSGPIARTDISRLTKINIVTISNYVDSYIKKGLVAEKGQDISSGGRKPLLVDLTAGANYVIGIGLNVSDILGVIVDLKGKVCWQVERERPIAKTGPVLIDIMAEMVGELLAKSGLDKSSIRGLGVGMPGIVDEEAHNIRWPGALGSSDIFVTASMSELFKKKFGISCLVENDSDCAVFGEKWFGSIPGIRDMIYMFSGVGCGIMINGQIHRGFKGCAGELGIFNPNEGDPDTWVRDSFNLGRWEIDLGITSQAKHAFEENRSSKIFELVNNDLEKVSFKTVLEAAASKDKLAVSLLENAGKNLGKKVAFLVNLINPQMVVVGGGIEQGGAVFLDYLKKTVKAWSIEEATRDLKIVSSQLGNTAVSLGAAGLVIQNIFAHA